MKKVEQSKITPATNAWQPPRVSSLAGVQPTTFGSFLRRQRVAKGFSRPRLGHLSGLKEATLEKVERNQASLSYQDIKRLAAALAIPEQALMEGAGYVKRG